MTATGTIIIIDDDKDDQDILREVMKDLAVRNPLLFFDDCDTAFNYLMSEPQKPLLIICDINIPKTSGIELKRRIDQTDYLRRKAIPFVFLTTSDNQSIVNEAYRITNLQGYFVKAHAMQEIRDRIRLILAYWTSAIHPEP